MIQNYISLYAIFLSSFWGPLYTLIELDPEQKIVEDSKVIEDNNVIQEQQNLKVINAITNTTDTTQIKNILTEYAGQATKAENKVQFLEKLLISFKNTLEKSQDIELSTWKKIAKLLVKTVAAISQNPKIQILSLEIEKVCQEKIKAHYQKDPSLQYPDTDNMKPLTPEDIKFAVEASFPDWTKSNTLPSKDGNIHEGNMLSTTIQNFATDLNNSTAILKNANINWENLQSKIEPTINSELTKLNDVYNKKITSLTKDLIGDNLMADIATKNAAEEFHKAHKELVKSEIEKELLAISPEKGKLARAEIKRAEFKIILLNDEIELIKLSNGKQKSDNTQPEPNQQEIEKQIKQLTVDISELKEKIKENHKDIKEIQRKFIVNKSQTDQTGHAQVNIHTKSNQQQIV